MKLQSFDRRRLLTGAAACAMAGAGAGTVSLLAGEPATQHNVLEPRPTSFSFLPGTSTNGVLSYADQAPAPVLRVRQGKRLSVVLRNGLDEPTTVHWHGIRLLNRFDGVPFLTQPYVQPGETFTYEFTPPDAGTYWYHPHCNSLVQLSRGLTGLLIVEEKLPPAFDADIAINLRDWRLGRDGRFLPPYVLRQSARGGTLGDVRTANWMAAPLYDVPSGGIARLRLCATDITRLYRLKVGDAPSTVVALDGNPLEAPQSFELVVLAPGQRADIAVLMPSEEGREVNIVDFSSQQSTILARLRAAGSSQRRDLRELAPLPKNPIAEPDLTAAEGVTLALTASAEQIAKSAFCGNLGYALWAINGTPWPGSSPDPLAPLFEMKLGRSYLVQIHNRTPHAHPVHLHGLSFRLLHSDRRSLPSIFTDTVLVLPDERVTVALVADNPGDWLLHCHVIEHQETGMTAFIRIT